MLNLGCFQQSQKNQKQYPDSESLENVSGPSKFLQQYLKFINGKSDNTNNNDEHGEITSIHFSHQQIKNMQKLKNSQIQVVQTYQQELTILQAHNSNNYEVIELIVQISYFKKKIIIYNSESESCLHSQLFISKFGGFGNIYFAKSLQKQYSIKCMKFDQNILTKKSTLFQQDFSQVFCSVLKEFFFIQLFSALEIGPKVFNMFGFDLVIYKNCIQFSTEICQNLDFNDQFQIQSLKNDLKIMHSLKIVHRDIKPDNIMFSKSFQKNVFIDLGCCDFIQETIGNSSRTKFVGTYEFCGPQMLKNYKVESTLVDLYYNDVFSLQKTFEVIQKNIKKYFSHNPQRQVYKGDSIKMNHSMIQLKYLCWTGQIYHLKQSIKNILCELSEEEIKQFFDFLISLHPFQKYINSFQKLNPLKNKYIHVNISSKFSIYFFSMFRHHITTNQESQSFQIKSIQPLKLKCTKLKLMQYKHFSQLTSKIVDILSQKKKIQSALFDIYSAQRLTSSQHAFFVLKYISFTEQYYQQTVSDKLKACQVYLQLRQHQKDNQCQRQCQQQQKQKHLQSLSYNSGQQWKIFVKVIKILHKKQFNMNQIPMFQKEFILTLVTNYILLSYEEYIFQQYYQQVCQSFLINLNVKYKILFFWKCFSIFYAYNPILLNCNLQPKFQNLPNFKKYYNKIFQLQSDQKLNSNKLLKQSTYFYQNLRQIVHELKVSNFEKIIKTMMNYELFKQQLSVYQYQEFRCDVIFSFYHASFMAGFQTQIEHEAPLYYLFNTQTMKDNPKMIPMSFSSFVKLHGSQKNYKNLNRAINFMDSIIGFQDVSIRFQTNLRFQLAFYKRDDKMFGKIIKIISTLNINLNTHFQFLFRSLFSIQIFDAYVLCKLERQFQKNNFSSLTVLLEKALIGLDRSKNFLKFDQNLSSFNLCQLKQIKDKNHTNIRTICLFYSVFLIFLQIAIELKINNQTYLCEILYKIKNQFQQLGRSLLKICSQQEYLQLYLFFMTKNCLLPEYNQLLYQLESVQKNLIVYKSILQKFQKTQILKIQQVQFFMHKTVRKIQLFKHQKQDYQDFIQFYNVLVKIKDMSMLAYFNGLIVGLWRAFIICQLEYQKLFTFLRLQIQYLVSHPSDVYIFAFNIQIRVFFNCTCVNCYPFQTSFQPIKFVTYIYQKLVQQKEQTHPQFCLIYFYCLRNKQISTQMKNQFLRAIYRNIKFVNFSIKTIILSKLYEYVSQGFEQKKQRKKNYFNNKHAIYSDQQYDLNQIIKIRGKNITNINKKVNNNSIVSSKKFNLIKRKIQKKFQVFHKCKQNLK